MYAWLTIAAATLIVVGLTGLPVGIQSASAQQSDAGPRSGAAANDVNHAKEMASLVAQGQLNLRDATAIAERHVKGTALEASCQIRTTAAQPPRGDRPKPQPEPRGPSADDGQQRERQDAGGQTQGDAGVKRLVYEVCCFAADKIQVVTVDGLTKGVVEVKERNTLSMRNRE
jgi:hypothetical protein